MTLNDRDMLKIVRRTAEKLGLDPVEIMDVAMEAARQTMAEDLDVNTYADMRPKPKFDDFLGFIAGEYGDDMAHRLAEEGKA